jgi:hypothetical protein
VQKKKKKKKSKNTQHKNEISKIPNIKKGWQSGSSAWQV